MAGGSHAAVLCRSAGGESYPFVKDRVTRSVPNPVVAGMNGESRRRPHEPFRSLFWNGLAEGETIPK